MTQYPLSIRDVPPGDGAERLTGVREDGWPDGVHTGGAWLWQGVVYKPLDCRPFAGCEHHYSTHEAEVLELMAGCPLFPRNWWLEERNGRCWMVREKAQIIPRDLGYETLILRELMQVEWGIRALNRSKWEIADLICLGRDPQGCLFQVDCSAACNVAGLPDSQINEFWRVQDFWKRAGAKGLADLRQAGRHLTASARYSMQYPQHKHVYVVSANAARVDLADVQVEAPGGAVVLPGYIDPYDGINKILPEDCKVLPGQMRQGIQYWVLTEELIPETPLLTWSWSPWHADITAIIQQKEVLAEEMMAV